MSDPSDPYRNIDIGGGMNPFGETIADITEFSDTIGEITENFSQTEDVLMAISDSLEGISKKLEGFSPVAKEMNKSKFSKATKGLTGMFKSMGAASPKAAVIMSLMNTLKPLVALFRPFQVILDLISMLIRTMVGTALKPMFAALQPIFDVFLELVPIFEDIGLIVGELLAAFLEPLVDLFRQLMPVIMPIIQSIIVLIALALEPLFDIFSAIIPIIVTIIELALFPLQIILEILEPILEALAPVFGLIADAIEALAPVIDWVADLIKTVFWNAFKAIVIALAWAADVFTLGFAGAVDKAYAFLARIERDLFPPETAAEEEERWTTPPYENEPKPEPIGLPGGGIPHPGLQEGGVVLSRGLYEIGEQEPEFVYSVKKWEKSIATQNALLSSMNDELVSLSASNREIVRTKKSKYIFNKITNKR